ncbi:hypothetical protein H2201_000345 [Coniosporium apollinis]|uniref:Shugoshin C-terminal domain-containing protein n=1 Tax=Coniosporium apollinis TaxID=61459 RepID=A0ABQ9P588_9PEZI|nr:hypothetical protein H2201_000345 [Coniosporium apollinis]
MYIYGEPQSSGSEPGEEDPIDDRQAGPLVRETGPKRRIPSSARRKPLSALQRAIKKPKVTATTQLDLSPFKVIETVVASSQSSLSSHDGFIGSELLVPPRPSYRRRSRVEIKTFHGAQRELCLAVGSPPVTFSADPFPDGRLLINSDPIAVSSAPSNNPSPNSGMLASEFGDLSIMEPRKRSAEAHSASSLVLGSDDSAVRRKRGREMTEEEVFHELAQITAPARSRSESDPDDSPTEGEDTEAESHEEDECENGPPPAPSRLHRRYSRSIRIEPVEDIEMLDEDGILTKADATYRDRNRNGSGYQAQQSQNQDAESGDEAHLPGQAARMESSGAWMEVREEIFDDAAFIVHATQPALASQGSTVKSNMKNGSKNTWLTADKFGAGTCLADCQEHNAGSRIEVPASSDYFSSHRTRFVEETDDELLEPGVPSDAGPPMHREFSLIQVHPRPDLVSATKHTGPPKYLKTLTEAACHELGTTPARRRRTASLPFKPPFKAHQKSND